MNPNEVPRTIGWLLIAGAVVFWAGAVTPPYRQWMTASLDEYLSIVGANVFNWRVMHGLFASGTVLTLIGLSALTSRFRGTRGDTWAAIGATLFTLSALLWLLQVAFRVTVTSWASTELAMSGHVPGEYVALHRWMGAIFGAHMLLGYLAEAAYGFAILNASMLPKWSAWTAICLGTLALPGLATPVFQPPLMLEVVPFALGIAIVRAST
ncbi:MAG: hypothetical protein ACOY0T_27530 [Myxococcota bacterium]